MTTKIIIFWLYTKFLLKINVKFFTVKGKKQFLWRKPIMADFIDFIAKEAGNREAGKIFIELLKKGDATELKKFFDSNGYSDVSLDDCKRLIQNKQNIISAAENNLKDY